MDPRQEEFLDLAAADEQQPDVEPRRKKARTGTGGRSRSRYWCWTKNNYGLDDLLVPGRWFEEGIVTYVIFGEEKAPTTGTKHLQGYLELRNERSLTGLKKCLGWGDIHLEIRRGTGPEAIDYCRKAGPERVAEYGEAAPGQGSRVDLEAARLDIVSGQYNPLELWMRNFGCYVRYAKNLDRFAEMYRQSLVTTPYRKKRVVYLVGHTGTGKTSMATNILCDKYGMAATYVKPPGSWFSGMHSGHRAMVLDEFRSDLPLTLLLRLLDGYDNFVEFKGGAVNTSNVEEIWITSNVSLDACYPNVERGLVKPLYRRIDEYWYFPVAPPDRVGKVCTKPFNRTEYLKNVLINGV